MNADYQSAYQTWRGTPSLFPVPTSSGGGAGKSGLPGFGPGFLVTLPHGTLAPQIDLAIAGDARFFVASPSAGVVAAVQNDGSLIAAQSIPQPTGGSAGCGGSFVDSTMAAAMRAEAAWYSNRGSPKRVIHV